MKGLTAKEEEIMGFFWEKGPLFVKEMLAFYEDYQIKRLPQSEHIL